MSTLAQKGGRFIHVLLVEDNPGDVTLIKEVFKTSKHLITVSRAQDGVEALDFLKDETPDLILLDLNMPKKSGFEVLAEIKADPRLAEVPVVVLTNSKLDTDVSRAYESRANFYIVKPSDLEKLFVALRYVEATWL
ncbi:MAG TPA: response regulator [bacterium]|nr:response regulator [bacterium]